MNISADLGLASWPLLVVNSSEDLRSYLRQRNATDKGKQEKKRTKKEKQTTPPPLCGPAQFFPFTVPGALTLTVERDYHANVIWQEELIIPNSPQGAPVRSSSSVLFPTLKAACLRCLGACTTCPVVVIVIVRTGMRSNSTGSTQ